MILKNINIFIPESRDRQLVIYLDGLRVNKKTYLMASNGKHVIGFCLVDYESSNNWRNFATLLQIVWFGLVVWTFWDLTLIFPYKR